MPVLPLSPEKLRLVCDHTHFTFTTTAEFEPMRSIIGQPRGTRAIQFGVDIQSEGYNIYALGRTGTGRATAIEHFLQQLTQGKPVPGDWVYVHNFSTPHQPRAIPLEAGLGSIFQERMSKLIQNLKVDLPQAFDSETYQEAIEAVNEELEQQRSGWLTEFQQQALAQGFALGNTASGFVVAPIHEGQPLTPQMLQQMSPEERQTLEQQQKELMSDLEKVLSKIHRLEEEAKNRMKEIDREVAETAIQHHFAELQAMYEGHEEVLLYLEEVHDDVINQIDDFAPPVGSKQVIDLRRYEVNVLVDNGQRRGSPVVIEQHPTYHNLIGRIEYEMQAGIVTTHFTNIRCGSLHQANGGYLILNAQDVLKDGRAWEALKRALRSKQIDLRPSVTMDHSQVLAKSLDPEPIPLSVKIILLGSPSLYYALYDQDEDFRHLFKVRADFDSVMPRDEEHIQEYVRFVATLCHDEGLHHFDRSAIAKVVEYGSVLSEHQGKLSTRFGAVADLVREASYWASHHQRQTVTEADVRQALAERIQRGNLVEVHIQERILEKSIFIATEGEVVGQVNGLSVLDMGDYSFGQPGRITARTFMGDEGVIHIERETQMSGPIHEKGVLTLKGYLGGKYAQKQPLSVSASLTFEQNYSLIDGDSASSAELYALLSSLSQTPIRQGIAVTGSVNQRGEIQPIGGVNEKIEGFFRVCQARGLTGQQGVIIPQSNVINLMLPEEVVTAVAAGKFSIWPIQTIDEGIELLTGVTAGAQDRDGHYPEESVHCLVQTRLKCLAQELKAFGDKDDDDDEDDEDEEDEEDEV